MASSTASSTETAAILPYQPIDSSLSHSSHYSNNWYQLGTGFSGVLHRLTLKGMVDQPDYFSSAVWIKEFKDPNYTHLIKTMTVSDNAPFTHELATTTFDNLSIVLKPYFFYRLDTYQGYQNRSVILAGDASTGTAMWNSFGTGRVETIYPFLPFMISEGEKLSSTAPPPLTPPGNLSFSPDLFNFVLGFSWSSSTDPDWPENPLHYEINYSTSTTLEEGNWQSVGANLSASIPIAFNNSYTVGVRALDDFGAVSSSTLGSWSFPEGFVPPLVQLDHGQLLGGGGFQKITPSTALTIDSVFLWAKASQGFYCCSASYVAIYADADGAPGALVATSTPAGFYASQSGELEYRFTPPLAFSAGNSYWIQAISIGAPFTYNGDHSNGMDFFGSSGDAYAGGFWTTDGTTDSGYDAYFRLRPAQ
jgi:hypothetical protein